MSCRSSLRECRMAFHTSQAQGVLSRGPDPSLRDVKLAYRKDTNGDPERAPLAPDWRPVRYEGTSAAG